MADPIWDSGFFEGLINNTGLNFTLAYVGYEYRHLRSLTPRLLNCFDLTLQVGDRTIHTTQRATG
jgi:hypothetical protein